MLRLATSLIFLFGACKGSVEADPPRRPSPQDAAEKVTKTDCTPTAQQKLPPSLLRDQRRPIEAQNLADQGVSDLQRAASAANPRQREEATESAVQKLITALRADPYNVHATYNLAAAYARIKRAQCSVNLLERLLLLRNLRSRRDKVKKKFDRLLGRGRHSLDPDFNWLRQKQLFREFAKKI